MAIALSVQSWDLTQFEIWPHGEKNCSKTLVANYTCAFAILLSVCKILCTDTRQGAQWGETEMIQFGYAVLIRGSVYMSVLLCVHRKRNAFSHSLYLCLHLGNTFSLPNFVTYPLYFLTAYKMTSRPVSQPERRIQKPRPILLCYSN